MQQSQICGLVLELSDHQRVGNQHLIKSLVSLDLSHDLQVHSDRVRGIYRDFNTVRHSPVHD